TNLRVRCRERGSPCVGVPAPDAGDGGSRMRPVRFVALSEDGQALVLADEVGRLLTLPIDERVAAMMRTDRIAAGRVEPTISDDPPSLAPRHIQARIPSGQP